MEMCSKCKKKPVVGSPQTGSISLKLCESCKQKVRDLINAPEEVAVGAQVLGGAYPPVIA